MARPRAPLQAATHPAAEAVRKYGGPPATVRLREEGWELRCESCTARGNGARFWPLTSEFWNPDRGMRSCRACMKERAAREERERYRDSAEKRARARANNRRYRAALSRKERVLMDRKRYVTRRLKAGQRIELDDAERSAA